MNQRCVVPAQAGTSLGSATKWIPACAGMTPWSQRAVAPAKAGAQVLTAAHWVPAPDQVRGRLCAGTTV
jgi:hypothetical protein